MCPIFSTSKLRFYANSLFAYPEQLFGQELHNELADIHEFGGAQTNSNKASSQEKNYN